MILLTFLVLKGGLSRSKPGNKDFILENNEAKRKGNYDSAEI